MCPEHLKSYRSAALGLLIIVGFLTALTCFAHSFYWKGIKNSGFYSSDEGYFIQIVKTYFYSFKYLQKFIFHKVDTDFQAFILANGGPFFHSGRQGYIFLVSGISSLIWKDYNYYHGLLWSSFFGISCLFLFFFFMLRNFTAMSAVISTLLFSLSPIHIAFARSVHTLTIAIFLLLLGMAFYLESFKRSRLLKFSALSLGLAFTCHYNLFWIIPVVISVELYETFRKKIRARPDRVKTFAIYFSLPLILIEILTLLARTVLQKSVYFKQLSGAGKTGYLDYFSDLIFHFAAFRGYSEVENDRLLYYFHLIAKQHSLVFILAALSGLFLIVFKFLKTRGAKELFLALLFLPFIFYSCIYNKADKMILPFIPVFCLYIGYIFSGLKRREKFLLLIPVIYIGFYQLEMSIKCLNYRMYLSEAFEYMKQRNGVMHLSSAMYVSQAYAGKQNALDDFFFLGPFPGESGKQDVCLKNLENLYEKGFKYYLCYYGSGHKLAQIASYVKPETRYYRYYNVEGNFKGIPNRGLDFPREAFSIYDIGKIINYLKRSGKDGC